MTPKVRTELGWGTEPTLGGDLCQRQPASDDQLIRPFQASLQDILIGRQAKILFKDPGKMEGA